MKGINMTRLEELKSQVKFLDRMIIDLYKQTGMNYELFCQKLDNLINQREVKYQEMDMINSHELLD